MSVGVFKLRTWPISDGADEVDVVVLGAGPAGLAAALVRGAARPHGRWSSTGRTASAGSPRRSPWPASASTCGSHRLHPSIRPTCSTTSSALLGDELQLRPSRRAHPPRRPVGGVPAATGRPGDEASAGVRRPGGRRHRLGAAGGPAARPHASRRLRRPASGPAWAGPSPRSSTSRTPASCGASPPSELSGELFRRRVGAAGRATCCAACWRRARPAVVLVPAGGFGRIAEAMADDRDGARRRRSSCRTEPASRIAPADGISRRRDADGRDAPACDGRVDDSQPATWRRSPARPPTWSTPRRTASTTAAAVLVYLSVPRPRYTAVRRPLLPRAVRPRWPACPSRRSTADSAADPPTAPCCAPRCPATRRRRRVVQPATPSSLGSSAADLLAVGLPDPTPTSVHVERRSPRLPRVPPRVRASPAADARHVGRRARRASSPSAARRCSPTTTPTTPWRWAAPSPSASRPTVAVDPAAWRAARRRASPTTSSRTEVAVSFAAVLVVTGAAGFVGRHVLEQAAALGRAVFTVDRRHAPHQRVDLVVDLAEPGDRRDELTEVLASAESRDPPGGARRRARRARRRLATPSGQRDGRSHRVAPHTCRGPVVITSSSSVYGGSRTWPAEPMRTTGFARWVVTPCPRSPSNGRAPGGRRRVAGSPSSARSPWSVAVSVPTWR